MGGKHQDGRAAMHLAMDLLHKVKAEAFPRPLA